MTLTLGLAAAALWATTDFLNQRISRNAGALSATFWVLTAGCIPAIPLALVVDGVPRGVPTSDFGWAIGAGALDTLGIGLMMFGLRRGALSIIVPIVALEGAFASAGSIALLGEPIGLAGAIGLPLAAAGSVLASLESGNRRAAGVVPAVGSAVSFAVVLLMLAQVSVLGSLTTIAIARVVAMLLVAPVAVVQRIRPMPARTFVLAVAAGLTDVIGFAAYAKAARIGPLSLAAIAATQFATIAVVIGIVFLRERPLRRQLVGVAVTLAAVSLLATAD